MSFKFQICFHHILYSIQYIGIYVQIRLDFLGDFPPGSPVSQGYQRRSKIRPYNDSNYPLCCGRKNSRPLYESDFVIGGSFKMFTFYHGANGFSKCLSQHWIYPNARSIFDNLPFITHAHWITFEARNICMKIQIYQ